MFWPTRQQHFLCESDMQFPTLIVFGERIPFRQEAKKTFLNWILAMTWSSQFLKWVLTMT